MRLALTLALWTLCAPPPSGREPDPPTPPELPELDLPPIEPVANPLVAPPTAGPGSESAPGGDGAASGNTGSDPDAANELRDPAFDGRAPSGGRLKARDRHALARLRLVDLRDPFEQRGRMAGTPRSLAARFFLPDLKDPFATPRRPRPKNWTGPGLPVDIRDPFSEGALAQRRPGCAPIRTRTETGVTIQRPAAAEKRLEAEAERRRAECAALEQRDLRDPFQRR